MPFIKIPVVFTDSEEDIEKMENLGLKPKITETDGEISVNTNHICAYNEMDTGETMIRLSNGDCISIPLEIEDFEEILGQVESIIEIPMVSPN
jgi:hypothetical protein